MTARRASHHIALLRGINVAGKNRLPMKDLVALFEGAGCEEVRTYIQSGNVVFRAVAPLAKRLAAQITATIQDQFALSVPVVMRSAAELRGVAEGNPFLREGREQESLHVAFLADVPAAAAVDALDPTRSPGDSFRVVGRDVFLHLPNGVGKSKLTNEWLDRSLKTVSTIRNWRTLLALVEMSEE